MEPRRHLHIVDADSHARADFARRASALGHHPEVYAAWDEFALRAPAGGILLARDMPGSDDAFAALERVGVWLPLILASQSPAIDRVVECLRRGALDFLGLPCADERLELALARASRAADAQTLAHRRAFAARGRIAALSRREREVLDLLCNGRSNKAIARHLGISPRTVEIHRANMMGKLGAHHAADVVRLRIEAGFGDFADGRCM